MGLLYDATIKRRRRIILEELHKLNVFKSSSGENLDLLSYERLKEELVLASFRQIDVDSAENKWF